MASSASFPDIELHEDDVSGAKFVFKNIHDHSVAQLKRWLECRNLLVTGSKNILIERCQRFIASNDHKKIFIGVDQGSCYKKKLHDAYQCMFNNTMPNMQPVLPVTGWGKFPSETIPNLFNFGSIYHYIVESAIIGEFNVRDEYATDRSLDRGKIYLDSGNIISISDVSNGDFYYLKSEILSSFSHTEKHFVTGCISKNSGRIVDGSCDCKQMNVAGMGSGLSNVGP